MATLQVQTKQRRGKAEQAVIIQAVKEAIQLFSSKMSLRQIYYQLVSKQLIPNNLNEYKGLSTLLVKARKDGRIDYEDMEDRTRSFNTILTQRFETIDEAVNSMVNLIKGYQFSVPICLYQPILHIIAVEKQALESFFNSQIPEERNVILIINRGYNSLTQIYELAKKIKSFKQLQEIHCSYFGDHDPTGYDIERNFQAQLLEQGIKLNSCERIGITRNQITQYSLPEDPAKTTDARTKTWDKGGCVELDALPPSELIRLIKQRIDQFWDKGIEFETQLLNNVLNKRYGKKLKEAVRGIFP